MAISAKSVVFDITNNYGDGSLVGIRSIDFWHNATKASMAPTTDFAAYSSSNFNASYVANNAFNTALSKTGDAAGFSWLASTASNQRIIIVFNTPLTFNQIAVNNFHISGAYTTRGAQNVKITVTDSIYSTTTFGASVTGGSVLWEGTFDQHVASNVEDEQEIDFKQSIIFDLPIFEFVGSIRIGDAGITCDLPGLSPEIFGTFHTPGLITNVPVIDVEFAGTFTPRIVQMVFDLPSITFDGYATSNKINLHTDLPVISCAMASGSHINAILPGISCYGEVSSVLGADILAVLPKLIALFQSGAQIDTVLPAPTISLYGSVSIEGQIDCDLPVISAKINSQGSLLSYIACSLPIIFPDITGIPGNVGHISANLPLIKTKIDGALENIGDLAVFLPSLDCDISGQSSISARLAVLLPIFQYKSSTLPELEQVLRHQRGLFR